MTPAAPDADQIETAAHALETLRKSGAFVHCLTNIAAAAFSADILLAVGARPSLTTSEAEIEAFTASADSLLVNLGTLDAERTRSFPKAVAVMKGRQAPWVLDPVLCNRAAPRRELALELLEQRPSVLRLNAAELQALTGSADAGSAQELAKAADIVVLVTGKTDLVTDGRRAVQVAGGHKFMDLGTAYGCGGGALTAAFLHGCKTPFDAALSSILIFNLAGQIAGRFAGGPGAFRSIFIDTLHMLETEDLSRAKFEPQEAGQ